MSQDTLKEKVEAAATVLLKQLTNSSLGSFTSSLCILRLCLKCLYLCNAGITRTNRDSLSPVQGQTLKYKASRGQRVKSSPPIPQFAYQFLEILPELNRSKVHERFVTADVKGTLNRSASVVTENIGFVDCHTILCLLEVAVSLYVC